MVNDNVVLEARSKVDKPSRISIYMQTQGLVGVSTRPPNSEAGKKPSRVCLRQRKFEPASLTQVRLCNNRGINQRS